MPKTQKNATIKKKTSKVVTYALHCNYLKPVTCELHCNYLKPNY